MTTEFHNVQGRLVAVLEWSPRSRSWGLWRYSTNRHGAIIIGGCDTFKRKRDAIDFAYRILKAETSRKT